MHTSNIHIIKASSRPSSSTRATRSGARSSSTTSCPSCVASRCMPARSIICCDTNPLGPCLTPVVPDAYTTRPLTQPPIPTTPPPHTHIHHQQNHPNRCCTPWWAPSSPPSSSAWCSSASRRAMPPTPCPWLSVSPSAPSSPPRTRYDCVLLRWCLLLVFMGGGMTLKARHHNPT